MKYAECGKVEIRLSAENTLLKMIIRDDGKGFETLRQSSPQVEKERGLGGNGLRNMQARADDINAALNVLSVINEGTSVELKVQL